MALSKVTVRPFWTTLATQWPGSAWRAAKAPAEATVGKTAVNSGMSVAFRAGALRAPLVTCSPEGGRSPPSGPTFLLDQPAGGLALVRGHRGVGGVDADELVDVAAQDPVLVAGQLAGRGLALDLDEVVVSDAGDELEHGSLSFPGLPRAAPDTDMFPVGMASTFKEDEETWEAGAPVPLRLGSERDGARPRVGRPRKRPRTDHTTGGAGGVLVTSVASAPFPQGDHHGVTVRHALTDHRAGARMHQVPRSERIDPRRLASAGSDLRQQPQGHYHVHRRLHPGRGVTPLEAALRYAAVGWATFPVTGAKLPLPGSHGHHDATVDEQGLSPASLGA